MALLGAVFLWVVYNKLPERSPYAEAAQSPDVAPLTE
jgi:hypothetical protein